MTKTFIETAEEGLDSIATAASGFVLSKLAEFATDELDILKDVILRAINDAEEGDTIGETVADCLTILENENRGLFDKITSDVLTALVGLGLVKSPV